MPQNILTVYNALLTCLAPFIISVTARDIQQAGSPLTLDCSITVIDGNAGSPAEIVWITNTTILQRTDVTSSGSVYTDSYTITQLTTADDDRVIQCLVNRTNPPVVDSGTITLNVTGKWKENAKKMQQMLRQQYAYLSKLYNCLL